FSRIIDNSVISLENIFRHLETGASPQAAAEVGGNEVTLAVLSATLTTVVISLFASYVVAMTVIPLFCSRYLKQVAPGHRHGHELASEGASWWDRFHMGFNRMFNSFLELYERWVRLALVRP